MRITATSVYKGPNLFSSKSVIRQTIEGNTAILGSGDLDVRALVGALCQYLPNLSQHRCAGDESQEFTNQVLCHQDSAVSHVLEHLAIELQNLVGAPFCLMRCCRANNHTSDSVIYPYWDQQIGVKAGGLALALFQRCVTNEEPDPTESQNIDNQLNKFIDFSARRRVAYGDRVLLRAAEKRGIPWHYLGYHIYQLGQGRYQKRVNKAKTNATSVVGARIASHKILTNRILRTRGLPVPQQISVHTRQAAVQAADKIGYPVVVKPDNANMSRGVTVNVTTPSEVEMAFDRARRVRNTVLVEQLIEGQVHRLIVVNYRLVGASTRLPGHVVGDGVRNTRELIDEANRDPRRGDIAISDWASLKWDQEAERTVGLRGYTAESVPPKGEIVYVRSTPLMETGGTYVDLLEATHPDNRRMAIRVARALELDVAGIDFLTPDITRAYEDVGGAVIEVNTRPNMRGFYTPSRGKPRDIAGAIIDMLYPPGAPVRIPVACITGAAGMSETARILACILKLADHVVGLVTRDGVYIDGHRIAPSVNSGTDGVHMVMADPEVDAAVLRRGPRNLIQRGLGLDSCDVGAVLNIAPGAAEGGFDSMGRLGEAMRVLMAGAKNKVVLNADDRHCLALGQGRDPRELCYVSTNTGDAAVQRHIETGNCVFGVKQGPDGAVIVAHNHRRTLLLVDANNDGPAAATETHTTIHRGAYAAAIAYCMGKELDTICQGLVKSTPTVFRTPKQGASPVPQSDAPRSTRGT